MNYKSIIAEKLLQIKAIKLSPQTPFVWASGIKSPIYCDNRITLSYPEVRDLIKDGFVDMAGSFEEVNCIAGVATAGVAHGALLADALDLPYIYVRSKPKGHGRQNQIEGEVHKGDKVLVIEDLISTGGSSIDAVNVLRAAGVEVMAVFAIFNYNFELAKNNFKNAQCEYHTLSDYKTLLPIALASKYISDVEYEMLMSWNKSPQDWSAKYEETHSEQL